MRLFFNHCPMVLRQSEFQRKSFVTKSNQPLQRIYIPAAGDYRRQKEAMGQIARRYEVSEALIYRWHDNSLKAVTSALTFIS
jgi:hypothetical protein